MDVQENVHNTCTATIEMEDVSCSSKGMVQKKIKIYSQFLINSFLNLELKTLDITKLLLLKRLWEFE